MQKENDFIQSYLRVSWRRVVNSLCGRRVAGTPDAGSCAGRCQLRYDIRSLLTNKAKVSTFAAFDLQEITHLLSFVACFLNKFSCSAASPLTWRQRSRQQIDTLDTGTVHIKTSDCVKSLGVLIDSTIFFNQHVNNICKSSYYHIKALRHTRKLLSDDAATTVVCAMVAGRLDYCNAVLYGSLSMNIGKLQHVHNILARVVSKTHRRDHITPVLADLHWLPVHYRIEYKIALLPYKALTIQQPQYLSELIRLYETPIQLRPRGANICLLYTSPSPRD